MASGIIAFTTLTPGCDPGGKAPEDFTGEVGVGTISGEGTCSASSGVASLEGLKIIDYTMRGYTDGSSASKRPTDPEDDAPSPGNPVKTLRTSSSCNGETSWRPTGGSDGDWTAVGGENTITSCGGAGCGTGDANSCSGSYGVYINPDSSQGEDCEDYNPVKVELETADSGAARRHNPNDSCSAGSGDFQLIGLRRADRDSDSSHRITFLPMQITGTGVMTNAAWVTEIDLVEDQGNTLKVVRPNEDILWTASDHLDGSTDTYTLYSTNGFSAGDVSGNPVFVAEEIDDDDSNTMQVHMAWSCSTAATSSRPQGYAFSLADIGCDDLPQRLVMRTFGDPLMLDFEQYGNPNYAWTVGTTPESGGRGFTTYIGLLAIEGVVESHGQSNAVVDLTTIQWDGDSICTPDEYTFNAEQ